jgi:hypothetical protein
MTPHAAINMFACLAKYCSSPAACEQSCHVAISFIPATVTLVPQSPDGEGEYSYVLETGFGAVNPALCESNQTPDCHKPCLSSCPNVYYPVVDYIYTVPETMPVESVENFEYDANTHRVTRKFLTPGERVDVSQIIARNTPFYKTPLDREMGKAAQQKLISQNPGLWAPIFITNKDEQKKLIKLNPALWKPIFKRNH